MHRRAPFNLTTLTLSFLLIGWSAVLCPPMFCAPGAAPPAQAATSHLATSPTAINHPIDDKWALVVGVSKFQDSTIPRLHYSSKDAKDFADFLIKEQNFAPDHVKVLLDEQATTKNIISLLGDKFFPRVVKENDLVVIFYSSHGSPAGRDVAKENFVVTYDTEKSNLYATAIDVDDLCRVLRERARARRILVIMDACYSGGGALGAKGQSEAGNFKLDNLPIGEGQCLISSSSQDERSWESKHYPNGVFTHHLMEGLRKNAKLQDVFGRLKQGVNAEVERDQGATQTPLVANSKWSGNAVVLAAVPAHPRPMPPTVQRLIDEALDPSHHVTASLSQTAEAPSIDPETAVSANQTPVPQAVTNVAMTTPQAIHTQAASQLAYGMKPPTLGADDSPMSHSQPTISTASANSSNMIAMSQPPGSHGYSTQHASGIRFEHYQAPDGSFRVNLPVGGLFNNIGNVYTYTYSAPPYAFSVGLIAMNTASTMANQATVVGFLKGLYNTGICSDKTRQFRINGHDALEYRLWTLDNSRQGKAIFVAGPTGILNFQAMMPNPGADKELEPFFSSIWVR